MEKKVFGKYHSANPEGTVELFSDSTYRADFFAGYTMSGLAPMNYSMGDWYLIGDDTLIINSEFDSCNVNRVVVKNSTTDTSKFCVLTINYISPEDTSFLVGGCLLFAPTCAIFYRSKDKVGDTLCVSKTGALTFPKSSNFVRVKAFLPRYRNQCVKISEEQNIHLSDTISLFYDFGYTERTKYMFFKNKRFIINSKQKTIEPIG